MSEKDEIHNRIFSVSGQQMKNIILIGPAYPYKGGIAHYTCLLYRALAKEHNVEVISYKMQYPKFLYQKEQRDYRNNMFCIEGAHFLLHTADPINIFSLGTKIRKRRPDMVIMQWWHPYFAPCYWLLGKALGNGIQKIFICHNVFPHERFCMDRFLTRMALEQGNAFIVHAKSDAEDLLTIKKDADFKYNPHPTYHAFQARNLSKKQARDLLQIQQDQKMLLFFGFVREYKGLRYLLQAMPAIKRKLSGVRLMIAGSFGDDKENYRQCILEQGIADCVDIVDGYMPDDEVEKYFAACDLVVLPYESATQSGIVQIAYGFKKPVIVTDVGGLPDVVENGKTGYVVEAKNVNALAEAVIKYFEEGKEEEFVQNVQKEAWRFQWERLVEKIESFQDENADLQAPKYKESDK